LLRLFAGGDIDSLFLHSGDPLLAEPGVWLLLLLSDRDLRSIDILLLLLSTDKLLFRLADLLLFLLSEVLLLLLIGDLDIDLAGDCGLLDGGVLVTLLVRGDLGDGDLHMGERVRLCRFSVGERDLCRLALRFLVRLWDEFDFLLRFLGVRLLRGDLLTRLRAGVLVLDLFGDNVRLR